MTDKLVNGDYALNDDGCTLQQTDYVDEVLQNVKQMLYISRGKFYPNKDYGSYIKTSLAQPIEQYALRYAQQCVNDMDGVCIKSVTKSGNNLTFDVLVNDIEGQVIINIENNV